MTTKLITVAALALLSGCLPKSEPGKSGEGEIRHAYFVECMKLLPAGPDHTKYNDWDEVVSECSQQAYYMSIHTCEHGCPREQAVETKP